MRPNPNIHSAELDFLDVRNEPEIEEKKLEGERNRTEIDGRTPAVIDNA